MYDLCLFPSIEEAIEGQRIADTARIAPATLFQTTINYDVVSAELKGSLVKFLMQEAKEIKKSVKRMADNKIAADTKLVEKRGRQSLDKEEEFGHDTDSGNGKDSIQSLRAQVNELLSLRNEVQAQLDNINHDLEVATATLTRTINSSTCYNLCDSLTNNNMQPIYDCSRDDTSSKSLDGRICIQYYYGGKSGVLNFLAGHNQVLVEADFVKGLLPRREKDMYEGDEDSLPTTIKTQFIGTQQYFTPSSHLLAIKNREQEKDKSKEILTSITTLFNSKICTWNDQAKGIVTIMNLFGYGCSDEATIFIMGGTLKSFFDDVGIDISTTQIANSLPARSTLGSWEIDTATDCLFGLCWGMKETGLSQLALTTDHGHRKGQDHLVKLLSFPERTSTGDLSIGNFCLDVDSGGHTTDNAANAIALSVMPFLTILNRFLGDVKLVAITGDAGGGASVQNLHPALKTRKLMDSHSKQLSCDMHNLNKAFEVACIDTWGRQGIAHNTIFQMLYLRSRIHKLIGKDYTRELYSKAWSMIVSQLRDDAAWQTIARKRCGGSFEDFMVRLEALEGGDDQDIDLAVKIANFAPSNLHDPVQTRWGTISDSVVFFADSWVVIYFFTKIIASTEKSNSQLTKTACALLSLMHNYEVTPTVDCNDIDSYIDSFGKGNNSSSIGEWTTESPTPILQAVLYFLYGFLQSFFNGEHDIVFRIMHMPHSS